MERDGSKDSLFSGPKPKEKTEEEKSKIAKEIKETGARMAKEAAMAKPIMEEVLAPVLAMRAESASEEDEVDDKGDDIDEEIARLQGLMVAGVEKIRLLKASGKKRQKDKEKKKKEVSWPAKFASEVPWQALVDSDDTEEDDEPVPVVPPPPPEMQWETKGKGRGKKSKKGQNK